MSDDLALAALRRVLTARLGPDVAYARQHGIDLRIAEAHAGCLTVNGIMPRRDGCFDLVDDGPDGVVIEVLGEDAETVHDLVAWLPEQPARWRCWAGSAGALGTAAAVSASTYFAGPLRIFRTPLGWIQAGCVGLMPLDSRWTARFLFDIAPMADTLAAEDDVHAAELAASRRALVDEVEIVVPAILGRRRAA